MTEKIYQFKVTDKALQDFLDSQPNKSDFLRQTAQDVKDGKLVYSESINAQIKSETNQWKLRKLKAETLIKEHELQYIGVFHTTPSQEGKQAIKKGVYEKPETKPTPQPQPTPQPSYTMLQSDGTLRCVTCGTIIPLQAYSFQQADKYAAHIKEHRRDLYDGERKVCLELANK